MADVENFYDDLMIINLYVYNFSDNASNLHLDVQVSIEFLCNRCNAM